MKTHRFEQSGVNEQGRHWAICSCGVIAYANTKAALDETMAIHLANWYRSDRRR